MLLKPKNSVSVWIALASLNLISSQAIALDKKDVRDIHGRLKYLTTLCESNLEHANRGEAILQPNGYSFSQNSEYLKNLFSDLKKSPKYTEELTTDIKSVLACLTKENNKYRGSDKVERNSTIVNLYAQIWPSLSHDDDEEQNEQDSRASHTKQDSKTSHTSAQYVPLENLGEYNSIDSAPSDEDLSDNQSSYSDDFDDQSSLSSLEALLINRDDLSLASSSSQSSPRHSFRRSDSSSIDGDSVRGSVASHRSRSSHGSGSSHDLGSPHSSASTFDPVESALDATPVLDSATLESLIHGFEVRVNSSNEVVVGGLIPESCIDQFEFHWHTNVCDSNPLECEVALIKESDLTVAKRLQAQEEKTRKEKIATLTTTANACNHSTMADIEASFLANEELFKSLSVITEKEYQEKNKKLNAAKFALLSKRAEAVKLDNVDELKSDLLAWLEENQEESEKVKTVLEKMAVKLGALQPASAEAFIVAQELLEEALTLEISEASQKKVKTQLNGVKRASIVHEVTTMENPPLVFERIQHELQTSQEEMESSCGMSRRYGFYAYGFKRVNREECALASARHQELQQISVQARQVVAQREIERAQAQQQAMMAQFNASQPSMYGQTQSSFMSPNQGFLPGSGPGAFPGVGGGYGLPMSTPYAPQFGLGVGGGMSGGFGFNPGIPFGMQQPYFGSSMMSPMGMGGFYGMGRF
ncbi:hypothetical protein EBS43_01320 [bacterium]|nr:hypothetical protein [bacterium]